REERIPQTFDHKNRATGIDTVTVAVREPTAVQRWYDEIVGGHGTAIVNEKLRANGLSYRIGPHKLDFLIPTDLQSPLSNWLHIFGPSPYAATLHSSSPDPIELNQKLTHGVNLLLR